MCMNINEVVRFMEFASETFKPMYYSRKDDCFYAFASKGVIDETLKQMLSLTDDELREGKVCGYVNTNSGVQVKVGEVLADVQNYRLLTSVNFEEMVYNYLEYANDINLKRKVQSRIDFQNKWLSDFKEILAEEELEKDWESFKSAELMRMAQRWCQKNGIQFEFNEACA